MLKLNDPSLLETCSYIGGEWVSTDKTYDVINPATGELVASVPDHGPEDVRKAIDAAYAVQKDWAKRTAKERSDILLKWHDLMLENQEDMAQILTAEMGKPIIEARGEIGYGASFIRWFAEEGRRIYGDTIPGHQRDKRILVLKQPIGVVGSITPWNFPNAMIARKVAPALAAGCTFVGRPAELTPLSALVMAVLGERAGIPKGVLNIVAGSDAAAMGKELCENTKVRKITFTGSTRVGSILMKQCAGDIKKLSLELGGNAPFIVFDDADLDKAVEGAIVSKFRNTGQTCVCANRIYVQSGVYDTFAKKLSDAISKMTIGNGASESTIIGPLINKNGLAKVEDHLADAISKGARVLTGGKRSDEGALFFEPTVLADVTSDMKVTREETFGPLAPLFKFETEEEVLAKANDTEFGLACYFYANDLSRVWRMTEDLEYGIVGVNTGVISSTEGPFGGVKQSGLGREGSKYGIEDYLEMKYVCMSIR
jgi:succinate-semialdehyde dehydrogenase/glutarate-semialdehyde dehydrogenase